MLRRLLIGPLAMLACLASAQTRSQDVIYMKAGGAAFTMDVFKPKDPSGAAVIYLVSGGWFSAHESINPQLAKSLNDVGFTVFEVVQDPGRSRFTGPRLRPGKQQEQRRNSESDHLRSSLERACVGPAATRRSFAETAIVGVERAFGPPAGGKSGRRHGGAGRPRVRAS